MRARRKYRRKSCLTSRISQIVKCSRGLTVTATQSPFSYRKAYHRRHNTCLQQEYRERYLKNRFDDPVKIGKTLRSRKHHIPLYRIVRHDINFWLIRGNTRSVRYRWVDGRLQWLKQKREAEKLHPDYLENMILTHWWKI